MERITVKGKAFYNPFEDDNARNSTPESLPEQFVWTDSFTRLLTAKNHIVLGARGSGKTAIVKMLSHEYLSKLNIPRAQDIIKSRSFIGVYVPMRLSWVGALKNRNWSSEYEQEDYFQWRLNIACCDSLIITLASCLKVYFSCVGERARIEREIVADISGRWFDDVVCHSTSDLRKELKDLEFKKLVYHKRMSVNRELSKDAIGIQFELGLLEPFKAAMDIIKSYISLSDDCIFALCLDEAEYLDEIHHRIINGCLRTFSDGIVFKITTMPYKHYTLETNSNVPLTLKDDFDYVYIDSFAGDKTSSDDIAETEKFCDDLFDKRIKGSSWEKSGVSLEALLSKSEILGNTKSVSQENIMALVRQHANDKTIDRAQELLGEARFDNEIRRKMKGALMLRSKFSKAKGGSSLDVYSGKEMMIRCSDGNPRRFISLLNALYSETKEKTGFNPVDLKAQNRILNSFSAAQYKRIKSEPNDGGDIHQILYQIGSYFSGEIHMKKLSSDLVLSFRLDTKDEKVWSVIREAVGLGLVRPVIENKEMELLPVRSGVFRLSYILAPHFRLLPRKGKARSLSSILAYSSKAGFGNGCDQLGLL